MTLLFAISIICFICVGLLFIQTSYLLRKAYKRETGYQKMVDDLLSLLSDQTKDVTPIKDLLLEARHYVKAIENSDDPGRDAAGFLIEKIDTALKS